MKRWLGVGLAFGFVALASNSSFGGGSPLNIKSETGGVAHVLPVKALPSSNAPAGVISNASYHGGKVLVTPKVVPIFWGWYWQNWCGPGPEERAKIIAFLEQYGTSKEFNTITQYYDIANGVTQYIHLNTLTHSYDVIDDPCNPHCHEVTDTDYQDEILSMVSNFDPETVYEVFTPPGYFSELDGVTSCDGFDLEYCAYHSYFVPPVCVIPPSGPKPKCSDSQPFAYAVLPYPDCVGCQVPNWCNAQSIEHFVSHETREAVTHPLVDESDFLTNGWWNPYYDELDDRCSWVPAPFLDGEFGYQYEWSNLNKACIKWR